jgi:hypothetical protein
MMEHAPYRQTLLLEPLDLLEQVEQRALYEHLAICADCAAELAACRTLVALLVYANEEVAPPHRLRARLLAGIKQFKLSH